MASAQSLERLFSLHPKLIDLSLGRIERLLADLDHPERRLPPVIHIAGTNGKGSTSAFLHALIDAQGMSAQAYTSPHLVTFHERIRLSSGLIAEAALQAVLEKVEAANDGKSITFFEVTTVAAFTAFAEDQADFCLVEVGLGGKFDATNVFDRPAACIITPVALDHENFLGSELAGIAEEKAGILKAGVPAFVARQDPVAMDVIRKRAAEVGAPLYFAGRDWTVGVGGDVLRYKDRQGGMTLPPPVLAGMHQSENAALALACLRHLGKGGEEGTVKAAMSSVRWPARLQPINEGPLAALRSGKGALVLDGGHNVHAATMLAHHFEGQKVHLVMGLLENRDVAPMLEVLAPIIASVAAVPIQGEACHHPSHVVEAADSMGISALAYDDIADALAALPNGDVLIVGSLYLAGQVLERSGITPK